MDLSFGSLMLNCFFFAAIFPSKYTSIPATTVIRDFYPDLLFALSTRNLGTRLGTAVLISRTKV